MSARELLSELVRGRMDELGLTDTDLAERMHWLAHAAGQAGQPVPPCEVTAGTVWRWRHAEHPGHGRVPRGYNRRWLAQALAVPVGRVNRACAASLAVRAGQQAGEGLAILGEAVEGEEAGMNRERFLKGAGGLVAGLAAEALAGPVGGEAVAASVAEATAAAQAAETTGVGATAVELLELRVQQLSATHVVAPTAPGGIPVPRRFWQLRALEREVFALLGKPRTLREGLALARLAAQLAGLMADTLLDLGYEEAALARATAGIPHAYDAGDPDTICWAHSMRSIVLYFLGRYEEAAREAQAGAGQARPGLPGGVRLLGQLARAAARAGQAKEARQALAACERVWESLPEELAARSSGVLAAGGEALRAYYAGQALLAVGDARAALGYAQRAVMLYDGPAEQGRWPNSRAMAALDAAAAHLRLGALDEAAAVGTEALACWAQTGAVSQTVLQHAHGLAGLLGPERLREVREFREILAALERAAKAERPAAT